MSKLFKILALLFVMTATAVSFTSCGDKEDDTPSGSDTNISLTDTNWSWYDYEATTGVIDMRVEFFGPKLVDMIYTDMTTGVMQVYVYSGTYSVSGSGGTMNLHGDDYSDAVTVSFTVEGNKMKFTFKGVNYTLTKD